MSETIITAIITGGLALIGSLAANNKTKALILYRLEQIEQKQEHRIEDLEKENHHG